MKSAVEKTFVELLQKHQNIVHKICRLYTNDVDAHNDLFQEISIQLWKAYPKFRGESKFSTWMYRVGLNTSITLYRKSLRRVESQSIESVAYKISQEDYDDTEDEQLKLIYAAVHKLNDIEKGIILHPRGHCAETRPLPGTHHTEVPIRVVVFFCFQTRLGLDLLHRCIKKHTPN